jgi:hypothetical protein
MAFYLIVRRLATFEEIVNRPQRFLLVKTYVYRLENMAGMQTFSKRSDNVSPPK